MCTHLIKEKISSSSCCNCLRYVCKYTMVNQQCWFSINTGWNIHGSLFNFQFRPLVTRLCSLECVDFESKSRFWESRGFLLGLVLGHHLDRTCSQNALSSYSNPFKFLLITQAHSDIAVLKLIPVVFNRHFLDSLFVLVNIICNQLWIFSLNPRSEITQRLLRGNSENNSYL